MSQTQSQDQPATILHLINGEHFAGAERVQDLLAQALPEFGYAVHWLCLKEGRFDAERRSKDTPLAHLPMRSERDLSVLSKVVDVARHTGARLIHTHTARSALIGALASLRTGLPMVHHLHSPSDADTENAWRNFRNAMLERLTVRRARAIIPVSGSLREYLAERGYDPQRVTQIDNGVPIVSPRQRCAAADAEPVIGMVALFRPRKGLDVLIKALAQPELAALPCKVRLIGPFETAEYEQEMRALADSLGVAERLQWVGYTADVQGELDAMDLFVLPSLFGEGMPMVILEAMASGVPVVASAVEGIPEIIRDQEDGLLVPAADEAALARALASLVGDPARRQCFGAQARTRQVERYSDVAMAKAVAAVYDRVLEG